MHFRCEFVDCLKLGEKYLSAQVSQEVGGVQAVHNRTSHFRQVHGNAGFAQSFIDGIQALERAGIDVVD